MHLPEVLSSFQIARHEGLRGSVDARGPIYDAIDGRYHKLHEDSPPHHLNPILFGIVFIGIFAVIGIISVRLFGDSKKKAWKIAEMAIPVTLSILVVALLGCHHYEQQRFSASTALVTIVMVMEGGTFEQLVTKSIFRFGGTAVGGVLGLAGGWLIERSEGSAVMFFSLITVVFLAGSTGKKWYASKGYFFSMVLVTFILVMYGYFTQGVKVAVVRVTSCFFGVAVALAMDIVWPIATGNPRMFSLIGSVDVTAQILEHILRLLDEVFILNEIWAQPESSKKAANMWSGRRFDKPTREAFCMDDQEITVRKLQKQLKNNGHTRRGKREAEITRLQTESSAIFQDMCIAHKLTCRSEPDGSKFFFSEHLHAVFGQLCSLVHMGSQWGLSSAGKTFCTEWAPDMEKLRVQLGDSIVPFRKLLKACCDEDTAEVDRFAEECVDILEKANDMCRGMIKQLTDGADSKMWRLEAFLMTIELVISELGAFAQHCQKTFGTPPEEELDEEEELALPGRQESAWLSMVGPTPAKRRAIV